MQKSNNLPSFIVLQADVPVVILIHLAALLNCSGAFFYACFFSNPGTTVITLKYKTTVSHINMSLHTLMM